MVFCFYKHHTRKIMTDIMATIAPLLRKDELDAAIAQCNSEKINKIRINVAKIFNEDCADKVLENISYIKRGIRDCYILLDCAYPRVKSRIHINNSKAVSKDDYYFIQQSESIAEREDHISTDWISDDIQIGQVLFYGDGEGGFQVLGKEQNCIYVKSLCDFMIYDSKTIANSNSACNKAYESLVYRLCNLIRPNEVAFSFVEGKEDLVYPRCLQKEFGFSIVSKIETTKGIDNLIDISRFSDRIMIGRGDLGLYSSISNLYQEQQEIFDNAKKYHKDVYVATDILESLNRRNAIKL